ncbi:hypothetical protein [Longitalea luteola]|uniref:hypothetical protein n=1 Tax=Longitalea luteola TaxID=2812563 RepID=UPI001A97C7A0|nr:hypothetical protein [Longitalea luteola]
MRTLTLFLFVLFFYSCRNSQPEKAQVGLSTIDTINIYNEVVYSIDNKKDDLDLKSIEEILRKKYFTRTQFSVELKEVPAHNISVYLVKLTDSPPTVLNDTYSFIDFRDQRMQFLLPIKYNQFYGIDNQIMIGGVYSYREFDYYHIYKLDTNFLKLVLDTRSIGGEKICIGYYIDEECVDYIPDSLHFHYNKELDEIHFKGVAKVYCRDGMDRSGNAKVINEAALNVILRYRAGKWIFDKGRSSYFFW